MHYWPDFIPPPPRAPWHITGDRDHPRTACTPARCGEQPTSDPRAPDLSPYSRSWYIPGGRAE